MSESPTAAADPLVPTIQAEQFSDSLRLYLRVTNTSGEPIDLTFPTGQSFDFVVLDEDEEIWRWSADMVFTQAIRTETIGTGETQAYEATWSPAAGLAGDFTVRGVLTAQDHRVQQEMEVSLP